MMELFEAPQPDKEKMYKSDQIIWCVYADDNDRDDCTFGRPDKEENDKEKKRPDDLDQQTAPVAFSKSEVLPEQQLELKEESHLGLGFLSLGLGLLSLSLLFSPLLSFAFWSSCPDHLKTAIDF